MTPRPLLVSTVAALSLLVLGLAGCGRSSDGAAPSPTPVTVTKVVVVPAPTTAPTTPPSTAEGPTTTPVAPSTVASSPPTSVPPSGPVDLSQPPGTFDAAMAHIANGSGSMSTKRFYTPSSNIYCVLKSPYFGAACELGEGGVQDTTYCGNGPGSTAIGRIEFQDGTPRAVCNSDTIRTPGGGTLAYGTVAQYPGASVECISETIGVTCVDTGTQSGFFLAQGRYLIFSHGG